MLSRLRKSFRRKSSRRSAPRDEVCDTWRSSRASSVYSTASAGSLSSLDSSVSTRRKRSAGPAKSDHLLDPPDTQWQACDVTFVVGDSGALIGAHRYVLLARSDVFFRMFCGPMAETGPVVIPDVDEDIFRQFLEYLYVDDVSLTPDNVTPLHYLGRKYNVEPLVQQCLEFLHARLTSDNACSILEQAHCFDEHELYKASFEYVTEHVQQCLDTVAVHDLCRDCLARLLAMDQLEVSEQLVFKAALAWAEASLEKKQMDIDAENVRRELGPVIHLIRFPAMTFQELKERVLPTSVLTPTEIKAILDFKHRMCPTADPFASRGRQRRLHRFKTVSRIRCSSRPDSTRWTAAVTFCCDRDFFLHGLQVFACTRHGQHAHLWFSVLEGQEQLDLFNHTQEFNHTYALSGDIDGVKTHSITISPPLELRASVDYTLVLQANMANCYSGSDGMATVTHDDVTFRFRDAPIKMNGTTVSEGQIPCLVYSVR
nr:hypothetical protein BaRGS_006047 [Batillaria attramentaria]